MVAKRTELRLARWIAAGGGAALVVAVSLIAPGPASAATAAQAIASLNAQRAANGIPGGITENPPASAACAAHNNYEKLNGGVLTHTEVPGNRGYSAAGNEAAQTSVLAGGTNWNGANPFDSAPLHLAQLLDPLLDQMGVDDSGGLVCATTLPPEAGFRQGPPSPVAYSYPGNGQTGWTTQETASEGPFTPGDLVGLPQPKVTGPYLYVLFAGPWQPYGPKVSLSSASVTGPDGPVQVKIADGATKIPGAPVTLSAYMGAEAMVIPVSPLSSGARYTVQVSGQIAAAGTTFPVSEQFAFTTQGPSPSQSQLKLQKPTHHHNHLQFSLQASGAYVGRTARIQVKQHDKTVRAWNLKLKASQTIDLNRYSHAALLVTVSAFTANGVKHGGKTVQQSG